MVPMLSHSLFININDNITNVIVDITKAIGLEIAMLLYLKFTLLTTFLLLSNTLPYNVKFSNKLFTL